MEAQCVRCEVRTEPISVVQSTLVFIVALLLALLSQPPPRVFLALPRPAFWAPAFPAHRLFLGAVSLINFNHFCKDLLMKPTGFDPTTDRPPLAT